MSEKIDLIVHNIGQLCTIPAHNNGPQRGDKLGDLGLVSNAAVAIDGGSVIAVGPSSEIRGQYRSIITLDAQGKLVTPGLVDPHTHAIWAGDRADEFEQRIAGKSYQQIMAAGGGINRTMEHTRAAEINDLMEQSVQRLNTMLAHGTTTVECKTGYGLSTDAEITLLSAIAMLDMEHPIDLVATFLPAHAVPPEFRDNPEGYVDLIIHKMLPTAAEWRAEHWPETLYCDVFCEPGAFDLSQSRRILQAAKTLGMGLKLHADEFESIGGVRLAVDLGAVSVDHVVATPDADIQMLGQSNTVAVALPSTPFGLGHARYAPAQRFLKAGAALAIATDCNPGTGWNENMQFVMALAARFMNLTPAQALAAATVNAAYAIGRGDRVGSLEIGKQGDLVIWNAPAYQHLSYRFGANLAQTVIKRGQVVYATRWGGTF